MITSYLRESTYLQDIDTQRVWVREHGEKRKIEWEEFADDGVSGMVPFEKRPSGRRLLAAAKRGEVEEVIVYRFDRLGRDHADTYTTIGTLLKHGVRVLSLKEGYAENTPSGRFNTGVKTLVNQLERETTLDRSIDATRRLAAEGVWLGGIVPYGYRVKGEKKEARLVLSDEPIPGCEGWTEVKVIRTIYKMAADGKSCFVIAAYLTRLGIPPSYKAAGRMVLRNKRKQNTAGFWRAGRIRNIIVNTTYKGLHVWGKRGKVHDEDRRHLKVAKNLPRNLNDLPREPVPRPCPAIIDEAIWNRANEALKKNQIIAMSGLTHPYLLRGLVKCGCCGLTYIGMTTTRPNGKRESYYRCNGKQQARGLYGEHGKRCPSPSVRGDLLEAAVEADLGVFTAKPGAVIRLLEAQLEADGGEGPRIAVEIKELEAALEQKASARQIAFRQLTRGRATEAEYDKEIEAIDREASDIEQRLVELRRIAADAESQARALGEARSLLERLREKTDGELSFEKRRRLVEALVSGVTVTPVEGRNYPDVNIVYNFEPHAQRYANQWDENGGLALGDTGRDSWPQPA